MPHILAVFSSCSRPLLQLTIVNLADHDFGAEGAGRIAAAPEKNSTLTTVNLPNNYIGAEGAGRITAALQNNNAMTTVNLARNDIGEEDAARFAAALVATQAALHGMLSTVFGAPRVCRVDGVLFECTPPLQQLLGCNDAITGSDLCSFAASTVECRRLQRILNAAKASIHQAFYNPVLSSIGSGPSGAVLYAIILPRREALA